MLFNSYPFIFVFLPISLIGFYLLRRLGRPKAALGYLVACSFVFYGYWNVNYLPILIGSIMLNYLCGVMIVAGRYRRLFLTTAVAINISALGYFKYTNFIVDQLASHFSWNLGIEKVALPLAISFLTFQQITYVVDCYRKRVHDHSFLHYIFVVTFFPHLIAGPIVRFREMAPQLVTGVSKPALINLSVGVAIFIIGLAKKVLIADPFGEIARPWFEVARVSTAIDPMIAWVAALAYTLQLYFDFSGYSDMAIGLSRMFGFRLAVNFLSPYQSASIAEFWRRWHITLSRVLRDYLYIPLGGNRKGTARMYANLLITMALGGLWHGANWTFVVWGLYHGFLLAVHRVWRALVHPLAPRLFDTLWPLSVALTFLCVVVGWVLFRSPDFATAGRMLRAMADVGSINMASLSMHTPETYAAIAAGLAACWLMPNVYQMFFRFRPALLLVQQIRMARPRWRIFTFRFGPVEAAALSVVFLACIYTMRTHISEFLYFMF